MTGCPNLDVVSFGGAEADVAGAELDDAVVEAEQLEDFFGVAGDGFQRVHAGLWRGDVDQFDFIKLVHADQATGAEPGAAGLAAEAGGVGGVVDGELIELEDFVAMQVGDGDLCGGDQVEIVLGAVIDLVAEFGELAGADEALGFDEEGWADLGVAVLSGVEIEQEADEGALESGSGPAIDDEGAAGDFGTGFEVEHAVGLPEGDVVFWCEVKAGCAAPAADLWVFLGSGTDWAGLVREVGQAKHDLTLLAVGVIGSLADFIEAVTDAPHLGFGGGGVEAVFAADADVFGEPIAILLKLLALGLCRAASGIESKDLINDGTQSRIALGEALFDEIRVFTQEADIEHRRRSVAGECDLSRGR